MGSRFGSVGRVSAQHRKDLARGAVWGVEVPRALGRKYPSAGRKWEWRCVFPATRGYVDRDIGRRRRPHLHEPVVQRAVKHAIRRAGIAKPASCHTFRHSLATRRSSGNGHDIRTVQELLGHRTVSTTMIYIHALIQGRGGVQSPCGPAAKALIEPPGKKFFSAPARPCYTGQSIQDAACRGLSPIPAFSRGCVPGSGRPLRDTLTGAAGISG